MHVEIVVRVIPSHLGFLVSAVEDAEAKEKLRYSAALNAGDTAVAGKAEEAVRVYSQMLIALRA